jgi:addiction module HigA family antidote
MRPLDISIDQLSFDITISKQTLTDIIQGKGAITAEIALKLGEYFGISPDLWLGLQMDYESRIAKQQLFKLPRPVVESQSRGAGFQLA